MGAIEIDETRWPLVVVRFEGTASNEDFDAYLERMSGIMGRRAPTVSIMDARRAGATPAVQRKKQAEWLRQHERVLRTYSAGVAFVISNSLVRGALTAILWLQPMPHEHTVVATLNEAEEWAAAQLRKRGVEISGRSE